MGFDIDDFEASDPTRDRTPSGAPVFEGVLAIRVTTLTYRSRDPRDVRTTPETRWYEYLSRVGRGGGRAEAP